MINSKLELEEYLMEDLKGFYKLVKKYTRMKNVLVTNPINTQYLIYQYIVNLRFAEYHQNKSFLSTYSGGGHKKNISYGLHVI